MVDIHGKYQLWRMLNACGKMISLSGTVVLPEIAEVLYKGIPYKGIPQFFELDALHLARMFQQFRADVAGTGETFGLVRIARRCSVRLHTCIVQNDEITATASKNCSRRAGFCIQIGSTGRTGYCSNWNTA